MDEEIEDIKEKRKLSAYFTMIFFIISLLSSGFLIYNILLFEGIEDMIRYIAIGIFAFIDFICLLKTRSIWKRKKKKKKKRKKEKKESKHITFITFLIIYSLLCGLLSYMIFYLYGTVDSINKKYAEYSSSLITLSDNEASKIKDIKNYKIGILNDKKSPDGYIIPQEIIKSHKLQDNNEIIEYDNYTEMISDLYVKDIGAIFVPTEYPSLYNGIAGYENIANETKIIITKEKKMLKSKVSKQETESTGKSVSEPFTILLMGIDSTDEGLPKNAIANGDSLILITFNPKTLNATMLSIPRDSYVPIACWRGKSENKITHAAAYGNDCMINTIEDFFDINIDYYTKINFKGLVKLVDALGGIDVDVPQDLCTDDSSRATTVCIKEGRQHLNGEEALVLSRNRKQLVNGDFGRGQNQQLVIKAMLQKIKSLRSVNQFTSILSTVSNSLDTNLTTKQILSFYSIAKDIIKSGLSNKNTEIVNIQQLYLQGQGVMIYDDGMRMELYNYIPNTYSKNDVIKAMKTNLGLISSKETKSFSFSINEPYEKEIIGYGPYKSTFNPSLYKKAPVETNTKVEQKAEEKTTKKETTTKEEDDDDSTDSNDSNTTNNDTNNNNSNDNNNNNTNTSQETPSNNNQPDE